MIRDLWYKNAVIYCLSVATYSHVHLDLLERSNHYRICQGMCSTWLKARHSRRRKQRKLSIQSRSEMFLCRAHAQR